MPANLRIESGISAGTSYWIDRPVLRLGSDPQCEICVPMAELAPHALTLEYRGGTYRVYNRGSMSLGLGRTTIAPGAAAGWSDGDTLVLPGDLRLVLAIEGDPRPTPRPEQLLDNDDCQSAASTAAVAGQSPEVIKRAKTKSLVQLALIAFCVTCMGALLLVSQSGGFAAAPPANRPDFNAIVVGSLKKDSFVRGLVERLQYAQSFVVRGHSEQARLEFAKLRDQLIRQIDSLPAADRATATAIRDYVELQLGKLR